MYQILRRILVLSFIAVYLASYAVPGPLFTYLTALLLALVIVTGIIGVKRLNLVISGSLYVLGAMLFLFTRAPAGTWGQAIYDGAGLSCICLVAPLMSMPFYYEDYQSVLKDFAGRYLDKLIYFLVLVMVVVHFFGVFVNVIAIFIIYDLFRNNAELYGRKDLFVMAIMQGYFTTSFWSPTWPAVPLSLTQFQLLWVDIIPYGLVLVCGSMLISILFFICLERKTRDRTSRTEKDVTLKVDWPGIRKFLSVGLSIACVIAAGNWLSGSSLFLVIPLVALPYALATALLQRKLPQFKRGMRQFFDTDLNRFNAEITLFTACSFFARALLEVNIGDLITAMIPENIKGFPMLVILLMTLLMVLLSIVGINAMAVSSALIMSVEPAMVGLSPIAFSLAMMTGYGMSSLMSPFGATALIVSGMMEQPPWRISFMWHWKFALLAVLFIAAFIAWVSGVTQGSQ